MIIETILLSGFLYSRSKKLAKKFQSSKEKSGIVEDINSVSEDKTKKMVGTKKEREIV